MIRTAYPTPPARQFRLQWDLVTRRTRRALFDRCRALRSRPTEELVEEDSYAAYLRRREAVQRSRAFYTVFEEHFDEMVGAVCFAAQEGLTPKAESRYAEHRAWFLEHYKDVCAYLAPYEIADESDMIPTPWGMRRCDTFEALFLPPSIKVMLEWDNGCLIHRLTRAQSAAIGWYEELRRDEKLYL